MSLGGEGLLAAGALALAVVVQALAQALGARAAGLGLRRVTLFPFGGVLEPEGDFPGARPQLLAALPGPAASLALGVLALLAGTRPPVLLYMGLAGLAVAAIGVLPAEPLDGGRMLQALVWWRTGRRAPGAARGTGRIVRALIVLAGVVIAVRGEPLGGLWLIVLGLLLRGAAHASAAAVALREALLPITVREAMTRSVVAMPPDASVAQLAESFWAYHFTSYPVIADGIVLGIVDLRDVATVDRERWPRTRVRSLMRPLTDDLTVAPGDSLLDALAKVSRNGAGRLVVMEGRQLSGYLSWHDITEALTRRGLSVSRRPPARTASRSPRS